MKLRNTQEAFMLSHMYNVYKFQTFMDRLMDEELRKNLHITRSQYFVLLGITQESLCTQRTVAGILGISDVAVSKQLTLLERAGYITRETILWDKRSTQIIITKKGITTLTSASKKLQQLFESIFGKKQKELVLGMDTEIKKMLDLLEHFLRTR